MSDKLNSLVRDMMTNRKNSLAKIDEEKNKQIRPYGYRPELKETFDWIIKEDPDYIRRYLKTSSNIAYQTDVYVDSKETKEKLLYKSAFNNDSVYLNFGGGDKILIVCNDSSLSSNNYDFYSDVFVNGKKLRRKFFLELPSTKHYNFKTGARRFLIDEDKVNIGDMISIVIRKEPKFNKNFYTTLTITNDKKKTYFIDKADLGRYGEVIDTDDNDITYLDNLLVFKKSANELDGNYFKWDKDAHVKEYIDYTNELKGTIGNNTISYTLAALPTTGVVKNDAYEVKVAGVYGKHECLVGDILFALSTSDVSNDDNWGRIPFNIEKKAIILDLTNDSVNKDDVYLIINKSKHFECEYVNKSDYDLDEYLEEDNGATRSVSIDLVDNSIEVNGVKGLYLPLPVKSINDIEVYVDGLRAINGVDFVFVNEENCNQYIRFIGILKPNSVVVFRNKNIDNTCNFYEKCNLEPLNDHIVFDDNFKKFVRDDEIPNKTGVIYLDSVMMVPFKPEYNAYYKDLSFVSFIKSTDQSNAVLESIFDGDIIPEKIDIDGDECIVYNDSFGDNEAFEFVHSGEFVEVDEYFVSLILAEKVVIEGLVPFRGTIFVKYDSAYDEYKDELTFISDSELDVNYSYGFVNLYDKLIPICENYIEAYLGRRRIPLCNKRSVINRYLKIDDQHTTLNDLELYSEINWTDYAKTVIDMLNGDEVSQTIYSQLHVFADDKVVTDSWLEVVDDVKYNDDDYKDSVEDIFYGIFKKISFDNALTGQQIKQYTYPSLKVLGFFDDNSVGIDITKYCDFVFKDKHKKVIDDFNTEDTGTQYVTAIFNRGDNLPVLEDTVAITLTELLLESLKIVTNTNFFTTDDNILETVRVIGKYENGSEKIVNSEKDCDYYIYTYGSEDPGSSEKSKYYNGLVDYEGSYTIKAKYGALTATKDILVDSPEDKAIKSIDVISNSFLDPDDNEKIDTKLDIYATFNNNQVKKIDNDTVVLYMFERDTTDPTKFLDTLVKDENGVDKVYSPDSIYDLALDTNYKFRVVVYNNDEKESIIKTVDGNDYTDVTIKLLNNAIKNNHQIVYYDNLTAKLDSVFIGKHNTDDDYYYYAIKNLDGVYLTLGQYVLNSAESAMTIGSLAINEIVTVEFYNKTSRELTNQLLFMIMDVSSTQIYCKGIFSGNIAHGYEVAIDKLTLNEEYDNIDFSNAKLLDANNNVIAYYDGANVHENNNYTRNGVDNYIYVYFKNFKTQSGNVIFISNYIDRSIAAGKLSLDLFFEIPSVNKVVELHVPAESYEISEFEFFNHTELPVTVTIDDTTTEDEKWLNIEPTTPYYEKIVSVLELRPAASSVTDVTNTGTNLRFQLRDSATSSRFETLLDVKRCGLNRYCFIGETGMVYYVDINILRNDTIAIIDTINGESIVVEN